MALVTRKPLPVPTEVEAYAAVLAEVARVLAANVEGDGEVRARYVDAQDQVPGADALRSSLNDYLDRTEAFSREVTGALVALSEKQFYRSVLPAGMRGQFLSGAKAINGASDAMQAAEERTTAAESERLVLADRLEETVMGIAQQVAAAATELAVTAGNLSRATVGAVDEAGEATARMARLDQASREIEDVVALISNVAAQTKLLALNATIEAARAGDAGRGFAVVASEVKALADTTAKSTESITAQVRTMIDASGESRHAMESIEGSMREMSPMVDDMLVAVDGSGLGFDGHQVHQGLAQMAEVLRAEVDEFLTVMRG
jgi:methyl-accepting chemotaxis protein